MINYQPGDFVLISFPYAGDRQTKNRPALIILDSGDADVAVARVTTQAHQTPYDIPIADSSGTGLLAPSFVRLHKLATLEKSLISCRLGCLQPMDCDRVCSLLKQVYGTW